MRVSETSDSSPRRRRKGGEKEAHLSILEEKGKRVPALVEEAMVSPSPKGRRNRSAF